MSDTTKNEDPRAIPGGSTGYDSANYPVNGTGKKAWQTAGSPYHDVVGRELTNTGFPTGKMKDGTSADGAPAAAPFDADRWGEAGGSHYDPTFTTVEDRHSFNFHVKARPEGYVVAGAGGGQDGDVHFTVTDGDTVLATDTNPALAVAEDRTLTFTAFVNRNSVAVQNRVKAGEAAARASFNLYKA